MAALPQRGPHVRELFVQNGPGSGAGSFQYAQKESRSSYDIKSKKKNRAPPPPVGLGQYKPRILSGDSNVNVLNDHVTSPVRPPRPSKGRGSASNNNNGDDDSKDVDRTRPFIVGDKDTPVMLHPSDDAHDLDLYVDDLALTSTGMPGQAERELGTDNPLFHLQEEEKEEGSGDALTPNGLPHMTNGAQPTAKSEEPDGVYIPAPDYDEEEKTMVFPDEPDEQESNSPRRGKKVYKEYYGEDFAQYLSDEENGQGEAIRRPRRGGAGHHAERKSKTEAKRPLYKKREPLPSKGKKDKGFSGSHSLRDFSFADSKFGTLTRDKKRHSLPVVSDDTADAELFVNTGDSYEHFLRSKNGEELGDVLTDVPYGRGRAGFLPNAPPMYAGPAPTKDSLWKKLTWKFKKQARRSFDLSAS